MTKKTKVLVAAGVHGNSNVPPDRKFFGRTVTPFLEEAVSGYGKAAIIYELRVSEQFAILDALSETQKARLLEGELDIRSVLRGRMQHHSKLGFEDAVQRLNSTRPNSVIELYESSNPEVVFTRWKSNLLLRRAGLELDDFGFSEHAIKLAIDSLRSFIASFSLGDSAVVALTNRLAVEDPSRVIVISRGFAHRGIAKLLDQNRFEVLLVSKGFTSDFTNDAVNTSYDGQLTEAQLSDYARLEFGFIRSSPSVLGISFLLHTIDDLTSHRFSNFFADVGFRVARNLTFSENPEIAQRLGLMS